MNANNSENNHVQFTDIIITIVFMREVHVQCSLNIWSTIPSVLFTIIQHLCFRSSFLLYTNLVTWYDINLYARVIDCHDTMH